MRVFRRGWGVGMLLSLGMFLLPVSAQASSLMQMSEQLDRADHLQLTDLLAEIRQCTTRRDFECADQRLAKAKTLITEPQDRDNLARAYAALDQERHAVAMERMEAERRKREEEERQREEERERARAREREELTRLCARSCSVPQQYRACVSGDMEHYHCRREDDDDVEVASSAYIAAPRVGISGMRETNQRLHANVVNAIRQQQQADQARRERQLADQRARIQEQENQRRMRQAENDANRREQEAQRARARQAEQESLRAQEEQRRQRVAEQEARRAQEAQQQRVAQATRSELQIGSLSTMPGSRPSTAGSPSQAANQSQLARQQQEETQRNEQRVALEQYLASMRDGIRLAARTCYGELHVGGNRPSAKGSTCIDVAFRASCSSSTEVVDGVAKNFVGMGSSGCFGDTTRIQKMSCPDNQINVRVTDVTQCR